MKWLKASLVLMVAAAFLAGCSGGSREVTDCGECNEGTSYKTSEFCVAGDEASDLFCANPCFSHLDCVWDHWCVPLPDQGTPHSDHEGRTRWVCMPERFYKDDGKAIWVDDCAKCSDYSGTTCLEDTGDASVKYCSDSCTTDSDCLTGCCAETTSGNKFCAPYGYCRAVDEIDTCSECTGGTACIEPETGNKQCAFTCTSSESCPFGHVCLAFDLASGSGYDWVCVPSRYFETKGKVTRMGGDCTAAPYECSGSATCLLDDSVTPTIYFCSDACSGNTDCVTGCCADAGGTTYCAPVDYCE